MDEAIDSAKNPVVLVIDDTPDNLSLMSELLGEQYEVKVANNGRRGLRIAASDTPPDLILLDIMMPEMDGYAVCGELKANPQTCGIPVVFMSALGSAADERRGLGMGAVDYIAKPIDPSTVLDRIGRYFAPEA